MDGGGSSEALPLTAELFATIDLGRGGTLPWVVSPRATPLGSSAEFQSSDHAGGPG